MYLECPSKIAGLSPLHWNVPNLTMIEEVRAVLNSAPDEKPLQQFFEKNPVALATGLIRPHTVWVIPRPSLPKPNGGGGVPDFIICEWSSIGPRWIIVEIESPRRQRLTKSGLSAICNHAIEQIEGYITYIRDNSLFLRDNGWPGIHGECDGAVIIGRRENDARTEIHHRLAAKRRERIEILSYDRVLEDCEFMQTCISELRR